MTKPHSRLVSTLGNGGYVAKLIERITLTLGLAALLWLTADMRQALGTFQQFIAAQEHRDARQDTAINRLEDRTLYLERRTGGRGLRP